MMLIDLLLLLGVIFTVVFAAPTQTGLEPRAYQDQPIPCTTIGTNICMKLDCGYNGAYFDLNTFHCMCPPDGPGNEVS